MSDVVYTAPVEESIEWHELKIRDGLRAIWAMPRERIGPKKRVTLKLDYVDEQSAYGYSGNKPAIPGPAAIDLAMQVDEWLSWLDPESCRVVKVRAGLGLPWHHLIARFNCSESTLKRQYRSALSRIRDLRCAQAVQK